MIVVVVLELRVSAVRQVAILDVDLLDHALVAGQVDHTRAIALLEVMLELRVPLLAVRERDLEFEQFELALLDRERQLRELAGVLAHADGVVVDPAVDGLLTELDPALVLSGVRGAHDECREDDE